MSDLKLELQKVLAKRIRAGVDQNPTLEHITTKPFKCTDDLNILGCCALGFARLGCETHSAPFSDRVFIRTYSDIVDSVLAEAQPDDESLARAMMDDLLEAIWTMNDRDLMALSEIIYQLEQGRALL